MDIDVEPGKYVVAVSGGVDSMVLLDVLQQLPGVTLVVAHYDHGIRSDSNEDAQLVQATAKQRYELEFHTEKGELGANASEELARTRRYDFLQRIKAQTNSLAIITAHHQDDVLETAVLNLIRGTARKGLTSLASTSELIRPLLGVTKQDILVYAKSHGVQWREDSTNQDDNYLRNKIRHDIMPKFSPANRAAMLEIIDKQRGVNAQIDAEVDSLLVLSDYEINKRLFVEAPFAVSCELLASWLRAHDIEFDKKTIDRIAVGVKTLKIGKTIEVSGGIVLRIDKITLELTQK